MLVSFGTVLGLGLLFSLTHQTRAGNFRPYGVSITGFQGAGRSGQDASAGGYAGR
jgi:hypothetical protein